MAAGAFSDEFLLRSTEPTQKEKEKEKEKEKKKTNNLAVPGPRTNAQGSNRPFGLSPLTLTIAASIADQQLPIIMAVSAVGQQKYTTPLLPLLLASREVSFNISSWLSSLLTSKTNYTSAASIADQQLPIIMDVSAVGQQNYTTPLLPPFLASR